MVTDPANVYLRFILPVLEHIPFVLASVNPKRP